MYIMNWTEKHIEQTMDYLLLFGDLILANGQTAVSDAIVSIPESPDEMNDWCDQWLTENGRSRLINKLSTG